MANTTPQNDLKKSSSSWLIGLLIVSVALNVWQYYQKAGLEDDFTKEKQELVATNMDIEKELDNTFSELNQYKGINAQLDSLLQEANARVNEQGERIRELMRSEGKTAAKNKELLAKLDELKMLRDRYLEQIDKLLLENQQLKNEKSALAGTVDSLSQNLRQTISVAGELRAEYVKLNAFKRRSNDKYSPTALAKRANKIECCLTILPNKIAEKGNRKIHLRLIEPGGKVIGSRAGGSDKFMKKDGSEELLFSVSKDIQYNGDKLDVCLDWEDEERNLTPGTYLAEVWVDGSPAGQGSVVLR